MYVSKPFIKHQHPMKPRQFLIPAALLFLAACSQPAETPAESAAPANTVTTPAPVDTVNNAYEREEVKQIQTDTAKVAE